MKHKRMIIALSIITLLSYVTRVIYINNNSFAPEIKTYKIGDEVLIENDFFDRSTEKMDGYSVTVLGTEMISVDKFQLKYSDYENGLNADSIYLVRVLFKNIDNTLGVNSGINLGQYMIQHGSYINYVDREAYGLINKFDSLSFCLRTNSEKEFILPFDINSRYIDEGTLQSWNTTLVVSLYPHKKVIILN